MSNELPLKIRKDIRDVWDPSQSSVKESARLLEKVLGHSIEPRVESWSILWANLKDKFTDNTVFVPTVVRYTVALYQRLIGRLENNAYEGWTDQLLTALMERANRNHLVLNIEPAEKGISRPSLSWNAKMATFHLRIPNTEPVPQSKLDPGFDKDFENLFNSNADVKDDDWADVAAEANSTVKPGAISSLPNELSVVRLPVLDTLSRPQDLFTATGPYILVVEERASSIVVQCSHEPSLELLGAYLNKYAKPNPNDSQRRSFLKAELVESEYCFGLFDTLTVERNITMGGNGGGPLNPTLILAFIEGVMHYKLTNTNGSCRTYTSTTLFN